MYGRGNELLRLNRDRNDYSLPKFVRSQADKAYKQIATQLKDRKLMKLREQLIKANKAHDMQYAGKIEVQMRIYQAEDKETGL